MMKKLIQLISVLSILLISLPGAVAEDAGSSIAQGKEIAFDRKKGNCLGCHAIEDGELPGGLGPALIDMQTRYPDKAKLRDQIWDASKRNPKTSMPPFGKHRMLTEEEIDKIAEYIYSL